MTTNLLDYKIIDHLTLMSHQLLLNILVLISFLEVLKQVVCIYLSRSIENGTVKTTSDVQSMFADWCMRLKNKKTYLQLLCIIL